MTNQIVTTEAAAVNTIEQAANDARRLWDNACEAERAAWGTGDLVAVKAASVAERAAHSTWKAAERALSDQWRAELAADEEARLQAMCEAWECLEHDYDGFDDHAYMLTPAGEFYLDHHYQNDSEVTMLAEGGDSPYGDGTTGWVQPTPAHPCYVNGVADMDALSRYEDLSY